MGMRKPFVKGINQIGDYSMDSTTPDEAYPAQKTPGLLGSNEFDS